jgi:pSer/pThr/pTyr-binding forkhead associated (FHA) protein
MHANLVLFRSDGSQKIFPLQSNITVIGRRHDCDLRIPLSQISRRQCKLSKKEKDQAIQIHDLNSRNGTYVNGSRIQESEMRPGDYIKIGPLTFVLQIDGKPEKIGPPLKIEKTKNPTSKKTAKASAETDKTPDSKPAPKADSSDSMAALDLSDSFADELEKL